MAPAAKSNPRSAAPRKKSPPAKGKLAAPRPRWFKVGCWCLAGLAAVLIFALGLSLMIFSPYRKLEIPALENRHYAAINRLSAHASRHLFRRNPPAEVTLRLSADEVNALLEFARNFAKFNRDPGQPPPESYDLVYRKDGSFRFVAPIDAAPAWCFGGKIYAEGVFFLEKQPDKLILDIPELRLGRIGAALPGAGLAAKNAGSEALEQMMTPEFKAAVKEFYPEPERDGALVVVYRPAVLLPLLVNAVKKP